MVQAHRLPDGVQHGPGVVGGKDIAVAVGLPHLTGPDGVVETAGLPDDGYSTIAHGDHLRQAARLALRGHQKQVAAGIDAAGQAFVVADPGTQPSRIAVLSVAEEILISTVTAAQHHQLTAGGHDAIQRLTHQIHALVSHQPGHHREDRCPLLLSKAQLLLKCRLA